VYRALSAKPEVNEFPIETYLEKSASPAENFAPETPRNDSVGYTAGLSYKVNSKLSIDASFLYLHFEEIDNSYDWIANGDGTYSTFGGTYKSNVFAPGIGISYKL
jgi:long-chain fatty acid transport protein